MRKEITQFSNQIWNSDLIRYSLLFEYPQATEEIFWAIKEGRWDLLGDQCQSRIAEAVKILSTTTRRFHGLHANGETLVINIREFNKIYWIWVPNIAEICFFQTKTDANNAAQQLYRTQIDAYRKQASRRGRGGSVHVWTIEDERKAREMAERYIARRENQTRSERAA